MPKSRAGRIVYALIICACLLFIGHNLYRRHLKTALIRAVGTADVAAVRALLDGGADPNTQEVINSSSQWSVLSLALPAPGYNAVRPSVAQEQIACLLIRHGAGLRQENSVFPPYLTIACGYGRVDVVRCLLERGAAPQGGDGNGEAPLSAAVNCYIQLQKDQSASVQRREAALQIIAMLRARGARYTFGEAAAMGDTDALKAFLDAGTPPDALQSYRGTALLQAVNNGHLEAADLLLARGANPNLATGLGSPLLAAVAKKNVAMVQLLLAHGAKVNVRPPLRHTALFYARTEGDMAIITLLEKAGAKDE